MAKFNINTFDPIYPASNDKSGEIQLIEIRDSSDVSASWSPEVRIDLLPILQDNGDDAVRTTPWGRQTMFRQVVSENVNLYWSDDVTSESFMTDGAGTTSNISFLNFLKENVNKYENFINGTLSDLGEAVSIRITKVHVIGNNVQFIEKGNDHIFFHTYDVIFYGQESPNPYVEPEPEPEPCENLPDVTLSVQFPMNATRGIISVDPADLKTGLIELFPKGGGAGTQSAAGVFRVNLPIPAYFVAGYAYILQVDYTPLLSGTSINFNLEIQGSPVAGTYTLNDTGNTIYIPTSYLSSGAFNIRWIFAAQTPAAGENNPQISFSLKTTSCIPT